MNNTELIKDFGGKVIAKIETDSQGNKLVKDFYGKVLGRYDVRTNTTKDFYGKVLARGDAVGILISMAR